jgi:heat shock protein 5
MIRRTLYINTGANVSDEDKETISEAVKKTLDWLDDNAEATKEDLQQQLKDIEAIANPIVTKLYGAAGGAGGGAGGDSYAQEDDLPDHDDL